MRALFDLPGLQTLRPIEAVDGKDSVPYCEAPAEHYCEEMLRSEELLEPRNGPIRALHSVSHHRPTEWLPQELLQSHTLALGGRRLL